MIMLDASQVRKLHVVRLPEIADQREILHPELMALNLDHRVSPLDVGIYVYSVRAKTDKPRKYLVDVKSVVPSRRKMLLAFLEKHYVSNSSHKSIETDFKYLDRAVNWCDENGHSAVFCNPAAARAAYVEYSNFLFQEILKPNGMAPLTAQLRQGILRRILQLQFPEASKNIISSVPPIKTRRDGLTPPEDGDVKKYIDITLNIAFQFSRFLVDGAPFPFKFQTNEYHAHLFPGNGKPITPHTKGKHEYQAYNYEDGRIFSTEELKSTFPNLSLGELKKAVERAQNLMVEVNADLYHPFRLRIATMAMKAYACLLNCVVGANSSEFIQFLHDDAVELVKSPLKNELSAVKLRAKGLNVTYTVGRGPGIQILREYLRFREWFLNGRKSELLFFQLLGWQYIPKEPRPLEENFSSTFFKRIEGVFVPEGTKNIPPVLVRKFKSLTLHQLKHSPLLVGAVMNHSSRTNVQSYAGTTSANSRAEFGKYWAAIKKAAARIKDSEHAPGVSIAVGHCDSIDSPEKDVSVVAIEPDCKTQYGCLFCVHYVVHSDELDIHKLLSFQYVIEGVRANAPDFEFSEEFFKDVVIRIDFILEAVCKRSPEIASLVGTMRKKVFRLGILTPFWERRLQRYEKMGIYI
ncbi:hypothetical protein ALQ80_100838 [Pseudomonas coronafaciens pv. oryzae]|nr:hypothetical protein [Pseudomonas tremae]MCF5806947.1 hypothetical protein [Pseudomonas tremae]QGL55459.1 hypothetical protein POR16_03440 [Pseudomonas coronafaciens pv. oryzae str. 1_6]RMM34028.1 hypothetical protein ALQ80_100838 [Pseudomonas coronafaciens pv. oryzae]